ncbi:6-phosphogluconate dehydrogenase [Paucihalobacter sp.]|uniref:6-phosphogluconate dehydrogenase n=1 Tax=Paucihalobacter sp. TaxID=2850405 RepID=UPI002FE0B372
MKKFLTIFVLIVIVGTIGFFWISTWTYSEGTRSGQLIKVTKKGVIFKTNEAQLNMGGLRTKNVDGLEGNIWDFSVIDETVVNKLNALEGRHVKIAYKERYNSMPWIGKTNYIATDVTELVE